MLRCLRIKSMHSPVCVISKTLFKKLQFRYSKLYSGQVNYVNRTSFMFKVLQRGLQSSKVAVSKRLESEGYDTGISVYNSLTKSKVPLKTIYPRLLTWYNCGPTVYDSPHIGHGMCYVRFDIIRRILEEIFQLQVIQVTNVTDIDDKIINRARQLNSSTEEVTKKYEEEFFRDITRLNVLPPTISTRVTNYVPHIISFIKKIIDNGFAYDVGGSVYFDTFKCKTYGKFVPYDNSQTSHRVSDIRKKCPQDFALWKASKSPDEPFWDSPWGPGRPGWHIECSAMAHQIFGEKLDLHSGGKDLMFPHHENEEAQCCAHNSSGQWCNYWIHTGHLHLKDDCKMSKSLQNTITIGNLLEEHSANTFRMFCLLSHYRSDTEYNDESLSKSKNILRKIVSFFQSNRAFLSSQVKCVPFDEAVMLQALTAVKSNVSSSLADDFDTSKALCDILHFISFCNKIFVKSSESVGSPGSLGVILAANNFVYQILESLGMKFQPTLPNQVHLSGFDKKLYDVLDSTVRFRHEAKKFALLQSKYKKKCLTKEEVQKVAEDRVELLYICDELRKSLDQLGINVIDHDSGSSWSFQEENPGSKNSGKQ